MAKRAFLCLGVDRAGSMPALRAAASGARALAEWARGQGCDVTLLTDEGGGRVALGDAFDAVAAFVAAGGYEQLVVYFAGHGFLLTQGTEYWLLSRAPENPNEAVNLVRSVEDARNCGIPHVVFISDACRSPATGPPLSAVIGGSLFAAGPFRPQRGEIDTLYATQPGSPSWEIPHRQAPEGFAAIFTESLLTAVRQPRRDWIETLPGPAGTVRSVVTARKLKPVLEDLVPQTAADFSVRLRQTPEVRVETVLPKYFAEVDPAAARAPVRGPREPITLATSVRRVGERILTVELPGRSGGDRSLDFDFDELGVEQAVELEATTVGRPAFETRCGLSVRGAEVVAVESGAWRHEPFVEHGLPSVRLFPPNDTGGTSVVLGVRVPSGRVTGVVVAGLADFVGTLSFDADGRLVGLNYVPSANSPLFSEYQLQASEIEQLKAFLAVAAREGKLGVEGLSARTLGDRLRQFKRLDPVLGLAAAYAYSQAGALEAVADVFRHLEGVAHQTPIPFDVAQLACRLPATGAAALATPRAPGVPLFAQGWALLAPGDPLFLPVHATLRPHLVPALWTTFGETGLALALEARRKGDLS